MSEDTREDLQSRLEDLRDNALVLEDETDEIDELINSEDFEDAESLIDDLENERT